MNIEQRSNVDIAIVNNAPNSLPVVRGAMVVRYRLSRGLAETSSNVLGGLKSGGGGRTNSKPTKYLRHGVARILFFVWFKFDLLVSDVGSAVIT
jgi:hypothetical protein